MSSDVNLQSSKMSSSKHGTVVSSSTCTNGNNRSKKIKKRRSNNYPWKTGQRVEACDSHGNWYPAKIMDIRNYELLIHFQRWSSRFDEWFDMDSNLIRLIEEKNENETSVEFKIDDEVLARWSDSKFYPARIIKMFNDNMYCNVLFYDGYKKKVKLTSISMLPADYAGDILPPKPKTKDFVVVDPINHNEFVCDECNKGFRKEILLTQHKKHYHKNDDASTVSENQPLSNQDSTKPMENKNVKLEIDKLKQKITVKAENVTGKDSDNDISAKSSEPENITTSETGNNETDLPLAPPVKKRRGREPKKSLSKEVTGNGSTTPKRAKSELALPYIYYYYDSKFKKFKPNMTLPFNVQKAPEIAKEQDNDNIDEIVKCICPLLEENGLMVQCELCLSWQHGQCMGFAKESDVPDDGYFCHFCRNPPKAHQSQKNSYQVNHWLKNALDPVFLSSNFTPIPQLNNPNNTISIQPTSNKNSLKITLKIESNDTNASTLDQGFDNDNYFPRSLCPLSNTSSSISTFLNHQQNNISTVDEHCKVPSNNSFGMVGNNDDLISDMTTTTPVIGSDFDMSTNFFDKEEDKKPFTFNDFNHYHSLNNETDLNLDSENLDNLIDLKDEYFGDKSIDDDEEFVSHVKAANMLSSALVDVMNNLHAINYKIANHKNVVPQKIIEKQKLLKERLNFIETRLEKIEKEIELKDSYAIHTSSSTLTATSPEHFGFNDSNFDLNGSFCSQSTPSHKTSFQTNVIDSVNQLSFSTPRNTLDSPLSTNTTITTMPTSMKTEPLDTSITNLPSSSQPSGNINITEATDPDGPFSSPLPLPPIIHPPTRPSLARLLIQPSNSDENEHELIDDQRPSMTRDYLPFNMSDGDIKLEIACHYKDLEIAREIMLNS